MKNLSENKKHFKLMLLPVGLLLLLIFNVSEDLTALFGTTFESKHPESETYLFAIIFGFIGLSFAWTSFIKFWKIGKIEKWI